ncbi:MAG: AAA family ATPase [Anaerolineales bacterium]|nr:AAA family ATPase [Anaerolineales bacterium]
MSGQNAVTVFLAGPDMTHLINHVMPTFNGDQARYHVLSVSNRWQDLENDLKRYMPDVAAIEADIAPDPEALRDLLRRMPATTMAVIVLPNNPVWAESRGLLESVSTHVRGLYLAPVNWAKLAQAIYSVGTTERARRFEIAPAAAAQTVIEQQSGSRPKLVRGGAHVIAALSFAGGTGKSTIQEALAVTFAQNNIRTLLASFNSPAAAVGHFGLKFTPNASVWFERPNTESFRASLQKHPAVEHLDILLPPDDPLILTSAALWKPEHPGSIYSLIQEAHSFNYGVVLLDLPPFVDSAWTLHGVLAANIALLICRPTLHDQFAAMRSYTLFTEQLAEQHRIPTEALFSVINMKTPEDDMSERDFVTGVASLAGGFPPVLASFPYIAKLPRLQNRNQSPVLASETADFARVAQALAAKLVGSDLVTDAKRETGKSFLGFKIKLK